MICAQPPIDIWILIDIDALTKSSFTFILIRREKKGKFPLFKINLKNKLL